MQSTSEHVEQHRAVLHRIVHSPSFHKSTRSRQLLEYLAKHYFSGEPEALHEVTIGTHFFERGHQFDPAEDSIVRASMRQLRTRLADYYATDGAGEAWELQVPKGSYRAVFVPRPVSDVEPSLDEPDASTTSARALASRLVPGWLKHFHPGSGVTVLALMVAAFLAGAALRSGDRLDPRPLLPTARAAQDSVFERFLMGTEGSIAFVPSDSVANLIRTYTGNAISFEDYESRWAFSHSHPAAAKDPTYWRMLVSRELLNIGDASLVLRAAKDYPQHSDRFHFRQSRDLQARDLKSGNYVFFGSLAANPWVQVFDNHLNFHHQRSVDEAFARWQNRHPSEGEAATYPSVSEAPKSPSDRYSYAHVAIVPNLSLSGKAMLVAGLSMHDTEVAGEFVLAPDSAESLASAMGVANLSETPYFEVLLRTEKKGNAWKVKEVVAHRTIDPAVMQTSAVHGVAYSATR